MVNGKKVSFISYLIRYFLIVISIVGVIVISTLVFFSYYQYIINIQNTKNEYLEYQKKLIKSKVDDILESINFSVSESKRKAREVVKSEVETASKIASNLYKKYINLIGKQATLTIVKESLREIRYNNGRGYFFAIDMDGNEILNADKPELEGTNLSFIKDSEGRFVVKDMIDIAKNKKEGFYEYIWSKPGMEGNKFKKISYIKYLPELGLIIGTGEYIEDIIEDAKKDILAKASNVRFGKSGYIFIFDFEGTYLVHIKKELIGKTRFWYVDKDGVQVGNELLKLSLQPEGGYLSYYWLRGQDEYVKKIAYAKAFPQWKWVICCGLFEDEVNEILIEKEKEFSADLKRQLVFILLILIGVLTSFYLFSFYYTRLLRKDEGGILDIIKDNSDNFEIKNFPFKFSEFERIGDSIVRYKIEIEKFKSELLEKNEEYKRLIEFLPLPVTIISNDKYLFANNEALEMLKISRGEIYKYSPYDFIYGEKSCFSDLLKFDSHILNRLLFLKDTTGRIFEVDVTSTKILYEGNQAVLCVYKDLTEIKSAYEQIKRDKELIEKVLENIGDAVIVLDGNKNIVMLNSFAESLKSFGNCKSFSECFKIYNDDDLVTEDILSGIYDKSSDEHLFKKAFRLEKNHESLIVSISVSKIYTDDGDIDLAIVVIRDLTSVINNERSINQIARIESLGQLAGGIAHNFNNVLAAVLNSIEIIRLHLIDNPEIKSLTDDVKETVRKAKSITGQLIAFAKGGEPVKTHFNLNKTVSEIMKVVLSGANVITNINLYLKPLIVYGDEGQISQVIQNMLINALQSMDKKTNILRVHTRYCEMDKDTLVGEYAVPKGRYAEVIIEDNGCGIDEKIKKKIFDAYFTTKQDGTGLGLSSSLSIINKHGGHITFKSVPGTGTTFFIYLPLADNSTVSNNEDEHIEDITTKFNGILVMDDDRFVRNSLGLMLKNFALRVFKSSHGEEAIKILRENIKDIQVAILDLTVPGKMGGLECLKYLKEIKPELVCVVSSGYFDDPVLGNFKEYGFDGVLTKPYTIESLKKVLCEISGKCKDVG
jgi:signal transduction histidine kinase/ActR/RegA family two-component response regulator